MSNNIFNSSDDDIFEDYSESQTASNIDNTVSDTSNNFDKVLSDLDSPFKNLLQSSSLKVNFGDAFYKAAHEWTMSGYREANTISVIDALTSITNGQYLYHHRLACSAEVLSRKKTIIKFLSLLLNGEDELITAKADGENFNLEFTTAYFNMFFRSYYNIHIHTFYHEVALYKALCDITNTVPDLDLCDPEKEPGPPIQAAEHLNLLYLKHFDKEILQGKIDQYVQELFPIQDQA